MNVVKCVSTVAVHQNNGVMLLSDYLTNHQIFTTMSSLFFESLKIRSVTKSNITKKTRKEFAK